MLFLCGAAEFESSVLICIDLFIHAFNINLYKAELNEKGS